MTWDELKTHDLKVYGTPFCPDCHRLKARFADLGVTVTEVDVEADQDAAKYLVKQTGHMAVPYVEIDGAGFVRGWHKDAPGRWDDATFLSEAAEVLG